MNNGIGILSGAVGDPLGGLVLVGGFRPRISSYPAAPLPQSPRRAPSAPPPHRGTPPRPPRTHPDPSDEATLGVSRRNAAFTPKAAGLERVYTRLERVYTRASIQSQRIGKR